MLGVVGRESGEIRLRVRRRSTRKALEGPVLADTRGGSVVNTDEWGAYRHLPQADRLHRTVNHNPRGPEWARDDDGDGIREVHGNTMEGIWTGLRNFLRPFRGVSKWYLDQYVALFEWSHNIKSCTLSFLQTLLGRSPTTKLGP